MDNNNNNIDVEKGKKNLRNCYRTLLKSNTIVDDDPKDNYFISLLSKLSCLSPSSLLFYIQLFCQILFFIVLIGIFLIILFPIIFRSSRVLQSNFLLMNNIRKQVPNPLDIGLNECTQEFYVIKAINQFKDDNHYTKRLGVWYIPPLEQNICTKSFIEMINSQTSDQWFNDDCGGDGQDLRPIVLYAHGIKGSRGTSNRVLRYQTFSNALEYHVVAFDYRGFGDSSTLTEHNTDKLTAASMVDDLRTMYRWLVNDCRVIEKRILLWGHSLGSAVTIQFLSTYYDDNDNLLLDNQLIGAVLESPFSDIDQVIDFIINNNRYSPYSYFPSTIVDYFFRQPIVRNSDLNFNSTRLLPLVKLPLMMFHAEDDQIVPITHGLQLFEYAQRLQANIVCIPPVWVEFPAKHQYGHHTLIQDPLVPQMVREFVHNVSSKCN